MTGDIYTPDDMADLERAEYDAERAAWGAMVEAAELRAEEARRAAEPVAVGGTDEYPW
jgi:hypothetical protein